VFPQISDFFIREKHGKTIPDALNVWNMFAQHITPPKYPLNVGKYSEKWSMWE
jgi:hypothetical protein